MIPGVQLSAQSRVRYQIISGYSRLYSGRSLKPMRMEPKESLWANCSFPVKLPYFALPFQLKTTIFSAPPLNLGTEPSCLFCKLLIGEKLLSGAPKAISPPASFYCNYSSISTSALNWQVQNQMQYFRCRLVSTE